MALILVSGIPASGKSTMAAYLSEKLDIPQGITVYKVRNLREAIETAL